jgi:hypothetical protein
MHARLLTQALNGAGLSLNDVRLSMNTSYFYDNAASASGGGLHVNTSNVLDPSEYSVAIGTTTFGRNSVRCGRGQGEGSGMCYRYIAACSAFVIMLW